MTGKGGSRTAPTGEREVDSRPRSRGQALRGNNGWGGNDVGVGADWRGGDERCHAGERGGFPPPCSRGGRLCGGITGTAEVRGRNPVTRFLAEALNDMWFEGEIHGGMVGGEREFGQWKDGSGGAGGMGPRMREDTGIWGGAMATSPRGTRNDMWAGIRNHQAVGKG